MSDPIGDAVLRVLAGMRDYPPEPLLDEVNHRLGKVGQHLTEADLVALLTDDPNDPVRVAFHILLAQWDAAQHAEWTRSPDGSLTPPGSPPRRALVMRLLGLGADAVERLDTTFPIRSGGTIVISEEPEDWEPWYTSERAASRAFYWPAYRALLDARMGTAATESLHAATTHVVSRLADPTRSAPHQSKGLVVGHVQSGKTANFTGVVAKAIDAGYRLVIVLTGTIEILRSQTQRRIDMELVGRENILGGIDPMETDLLADVDYAGSGDRDWTEGRFLSHGRRPRDVGAPEIVRMTRADFDYRQLEAGLRALDFRAGNELADPSKPLFDEANLFGTDVRLAVVKKNKRVLERLVDDLKRIHTRLGEIPALVIDDEADQASVNTVRNRRTTEDRERSAINKLIAQVLAQLPRAQYVGYTATPFANVFVDPDDAADIFPKDFIISLEPPPAYMGGRDFHDLDLPEDVESTVETSNEMAFVRGLRADRDDNATRDSEMTAALDTFVLTGAVKLWRETVTGTPGRFRHHTMLVHESVKQTEHTELADRIHSLWKRAGYSTGRGLRRLFELWRDDLVPVSRARADGEPVPEDFADLRPHIGAAIDRISRGAAPVVVVNGDRESDYAQAELDFQGTDVWKILVGGAKLSRGFTVEGLTVSYYTRRTMAADTLMQMGRWFGYRAGYRDLVRLYVGRAVPARRGATVDLYRAFESVVRDEEEFRAELRAFHGTRDDGRPKVRPIDVPPMVFQSLPWLKPTGTNKMYNAVLTFKGEGGRVKDFFQQPRRDRRVNERHFAAVSALLDAATFQGMFFSHTGGTYQASYGIVDTSTLREVLSGFRWHENYDFTPTMEFFDMAVGAGDLTDWAVLVPTLAGANIRSARIGDRDEMFTVMKRERRDDRDGVFSGSSPRQRRALEIISGGVDPLADGTEAKLLDAARRHPDATGLHSPTRGAMLLTFAADQKHGSDPWSLGDPAEPGDVASLFSLAFPRRAAPEARVGFTVRREGAGPVVDAD